MSPRVRLVALAAALLASPGFAKDKQLTLLFTGDNRGEIAPCG